MQENNNSQNEFGDQESHNRKFLIFGLVGLVIIVIIVISYILTMQFLIAPIKKPTNLTNLTFAQQPKYSLTLNITNLLRHANEEFEKCKSSTSDFFEAVSKRDETLCLNVKISRCRDFVKLAIALDKNDPFGCKDLSNDTYVRYLCNAILEEKTEHCDNIKSIYLPSGYNKSLVIEQCKLMAKTIKKAFQNKDVEACNIFSEVENGLNHLGDLCLSFLGKEVKDITDTCEREYKYDIAMATRNVTLCEEIKDKYYRTLCKTTIKKNLAQSCKRQNASECITCHDFICIAKYSNDFSFCKYELDPLLIESCEKMFLKH